MAKKKDPSALFEVISLAKQKSEGNLDVPDWIQNPSDTAAPAKAGKAKVEAIRIADKRIDFSLNYVSIGVAAGGLILLLLVAFLLGRGSASSTTVEPAGKQPPTAAAKQAPGNHYLMIQLLDGSEAADVEEAKRIVAYLGKFDVQANYLLYPIGTGPDRVIVCSQKPFDDVKSKEAIAYAEWIRAIGKRYSAETGSKYTLRQRNPSPSRGRPVWPWYKLWTD